MEIEVWYPSHVEKAKKALKSLTKTVKGVIEIVDARAPMATRPMDIEPYFKDKVKMLFLNKSDLADPRVTDKWIEVFSKKNVAVMAGSLKKMKNANKLFDPFKRAKEVNIAIVGMPNVGKSTLVNMIKKRRSASIGDRPGVTRAVQWIRVNDRLRVLDTPGVSYPKIFNDLLYAKLGLCNVIDVEKIDFEALIYYELNLLCKIHPEIFEKIAEGASVMERVENYAKKRNFLLKGGVLDMNRALLTLHREITHGEFGRISYETPEEFDKI
jgi:ribosome biogenesis GTPase A